MSKNSWFSRGKLLLSGEYLVIKGAEALALPLARGQFLTISGSEKPVLQWTGFDMGKLWFKAEYSLPELEVLSPKNEVAIRLQRLLRAAASMNPEVLSKDKGIEVVTDTTFELGWGFGSSSTLVSNISYWFNIDPFELYRKEYSGSGYDLACARSDRPLFYRLVEDYPVVELTTFDPSFSDQLFFVYLGQKQNTDESIQGFFSDARYSPADLEEISRISRRMAEPHITLDEFDELIGRHEEIMSGILSQPPVKQRMFSDFPGAVKSLGSWGGDFVMVTWNGPQTGLENYFKKKGLDTIFRFKDLKV